MPLDPVVNFFRSTIATLPLNSGTTTMVVASGDGNKLPNPSVDGAFNLVVYNPSDPFVAPEIVRCTARTSDTLTILRGQEGTSDATKAAGIAWTVELVPTAKMIQNIDTNKVEKTGDTMTGTLTATKLIPSGNVVTGNGMYLPAANTLALSTNGAERVRVISTGEVGIAKTPTAGVALDVTGAVTASGLVTAGKFAPTANTTAGNGMYLPAANTVAIGTNGTEAIRINASQNVAIGKTTANAKVDINGSLIVNVAKQFSKSINITADNNPQSIAVFTIPTDCFVKFDIELTQTGLTGYVGRSKRFIFTARRLNVFPTSTITVSSVTEITSEAISIASINSGFYNLGDGTMTVAIAGDSFNGTSTVTVSYAMLKSGSSAATTGEIYFNARLIGAGVTTTTMT